MSDSETDYTESIESEGSVDAKSKNALSNKLAPKPGETPFEPIYRQKYGKYDSHSMCSHICYIIKSKVVIAPAHITEMFNKTYRDGIDVDDAHYYGRKYGAALKIKLKIDFRQAELIINELIKKKYSLREQDVDSLLDRLPDNKWEKPNFTWVTRMVNNGFKFSEAHKKILQKYDYYFPLHIEYETKKPTVAAIVKYISAENYADEILCDPDKFTNLIIKHKIKLNSEIFSIFSKNAGRRVKEQKKNYKDNNNNDTNVKKINNLLNIFVKSGYKFSSADCVTLLCSPICKTAESISEYCYSDSTKYQFNYFSYAEDKCDNYDYETESESEEEDYEEEKPIKGVANKVAKKIIDEPTKNKNPEEKTKFLKSEEIDCVFEFIKKHNLNEKEIICNTIFIAGSIFLDYLIWKDKLSLVNQEVGMSCGIMFNNLNVLEYYTNKKIIAEPHHVYFSLWSENKLYDVGYKYATVRRPNNIDHFVKTGTNITADLFEAIAFIGHTSKYGHLCNSLTDAEKLDVSQKMIALRNVAKSITQTYRAKKEKKVSKVSQKSENIFIEVCKKNPLESIISHMETSNIAITHNCVDAIFQNPYPNVLEYFKHKYGIKPLLSSIVSNPNLRDRYFMLKIYYPEVANLKYDTKCFSEFNKDVNNIANTTDHTTDHTTGHTTGHTTDYTAINNDPEELSENETPVKKNTKKSTKKKVELDEEECEAPKKIKKVAKTKVSSKSVKKTDDDMVDF